jgi:HNH endonuclease
MAKADLTAQRLRELLSYDPCTGIFTRLVSSHARWKHGQIVGCVNKTIGYQIVGVDRTSHYGHRLAWLYMTGSHPSGEIDHINGDRTDNRFANLRDTSRATNAQNLRRANSKSTSGFLGVSRHAAKYKGKNYPIKWTATIKINKVRRYLGIFDTPEDAHAPRAENSTRPGTLCRMNWALLAVSMPVRYRLTDLCTEALRVARLYDGPTNGSMSILAEKRLVNDGRHRAGSDRRKRQFPVRQVRHKPV